MPPPPPPDPNRVPVLLGVGEINDRSTDDDQALDPAALAIAALRAADDDAGGGLLPRCDRLLLVPQISFPGLDVAARLSSALGLPAARIVCAAEASGDVPVRHLDDAANLVGAGEARCVAIAGGEALRTATRRARSRGGAGDLFPGARARASALQRRYGLVMPSDIYPLYENACRAHWGQSLAEAQAETAEIWSLMSEQAERSDGAWLRRRRSPDEILRAGPDNPPVAFPYTRLTVANASVNQGAALLVTSLALARALGRERRAVFVRRGASAHAPADPLARRDWLTPPSMRAALLGALDANRLRPADLDRVELYSCFPCVPKMARRVLDWPASRPASVWGGLTFGGGPVGNAMSHAAAAMVRGLRVSGRHGLLFGNGGFCTHNHAIVLSAAPPARLEFPHPHPVPVDGADEPIPGLDDAAEGEATLETFTVAFENGRRSHGVVLARTGDGGRVVARVPDTDGDTLDMLTDGRRQPVGSRGRTERHGERLHWRPAA